MIATELVMKRGNQLRLVTIAEKHAANKYTRHNYKEILNTLQWIQINHFYSSLSAVWRPFSAQWSGSNGLRVLVAPKNNIWSKVLTAGLLLEKHTHKSERDFNCDQLTVVNECANFTTCFEQLNIVLIDHWSVHHWEQATHHWEHLYTRPSPN